VNLLAGMDIAGRVVTIHQRNNLSDRLLMQHAVPCEVYARILCV
jgi:hypothetical protein